MIYCSLGYVPGDDRMNVFVIIYTAWETLLTEAEVHI